MPPHYRGLIITLRHTTLGRTPLDEWSARCRELYLTTRNTHTRQIFISPAGFEPTVPASERPQTHVLARAATGTGAVTFTVWSNVCPVIMHEHLQPDKHSLRLFPGKWRGTAVKASHIYCSSSSRVLRYDQLTSIFFSCRVGMSSNARMVFEIPCGDQSPCGRANEWSVFFCWIMTLKLRILRELYQCSNLFRTCSHVTCIYLRRAIYCKITVWLIPEDGGGRFPRNTVTHIADYAMPDRRFQD
jgi:hypothetical protein